MQDVERFNEWGGEADYAVMEYKRKVAFLRKEAKKLATSSKKPSRKHSSSAAAKHESPMVE